MAYSRYLCVTISSCSQLCTTATFVNSWANESIYDTFKAITTICYIMNKKILKMDNGFQLNAMKLFTYVVVQDPVNDFWGFLCLGIHKHDINVNMKIYKIAQEVHLIMTVSVNIIIWLYIHYFFTLSKCLQKNGPVKC